MNKIVIKYTLLFGVGVSFMYLGVGIAHQFTKKKAVAERTAQLPALVFKGLDGRPWALKSLSKSPIWLLYFNSECEFCQAELTDIQQHRAQLSPIKIVLVSSEKMAMIHSFTHQNGLDSLPNVVVVQDSTHLCATHLGMATTPSSLLYAANGSLIKKYSGAVKVSTVLKDF